MAKKKQTRSDQQQTSDPGGTLWAATGLLVTVFVFAALMTFSSQDWPNPHVYPHADPISNACGRVGAWLAYQVVRLLGVGGHALLLFAAAVFYWRLARGPMLQLGQRVGAAIVLAVVLSTTVDVLDSDGARNLPLGYAGVVGSFLGGLLSDNFNPFGTFLILSYCALAALFFAIEGLGVRLADWAGELGGSAVQSGQSAVARAGAAVRTLAAGLKRPATPAVASAGSAKAAETAAPERRPRKRRRPAAEDEPELVEVDSSPHEEIEEEVFEEPPPEPRGKSKRARLERPAEPADTEAPPRGQGHLEGVKKIVFKHHRPDPAAEKTGCYPAVLDDWVLPPVSLLGETEYRISAQQETLAREKARILEDTLSDFRIEAPVVEIETGPVITMFELRLAPGIKVSQVRALSNDIARSLKAPNVRVVAPIPGKNTVGIEVPRIDREKVRLRDLMTTTGHQAKKMILPLYLGKDASGNEMVYDLAKMPHMLIAGTTGSGKSVCINSIIMSVLMTQRPDRVKMIMVDPKMVELSVFKDVPHLMCPIVTDMQKAEQILEWACSKMDERYSLLAEAGVRNILDYNRLGLDKLRERFNPANDEEAAQIPPHLPYMVVVIDELADLMMTSAKEVEYHLARLAQKSRAVGIHIVVATQRPEAKVVTGLIKSNLPCRCAFRVAARMDSRIVLDQNGAEALLGQGDMLFLPPGSAQLVRSQGTFVEDDELHATVQDLKDKGNCEFHPELMKIRSGPRAEVGERDELFEDAVRIILESQRGSVSLLQRRLTIGYSRASRLVDQMAAAGIVGDYKGSQAREVLMTLDEWDVLKQQVEREMTEGYVADQDDFEAEDTGPEATLLGHDEALAATASVTAAPTVDEAVAEPNPAESQADQTDSSQAVAVDDPEDGTEEDHALNASQAAADTVAEEEDASAESEEEDDVEASDDAEDEEEEEEDAGDAEDAQASDEEGEEGEDDDDDEYEYEYEYEYEEVDEDEDDEGDDEEAGDEDVVDEAEDGEAEADEAEEDAEVDDEYEEEQPAARSKAEKSSSGA